jgi:hypothetical protein
MLAATTGRLLTGAFAGRRRRGGHAPGEDPLVERIRGSLIGEETLLDGPFGPRGWSTPTTPRRAAR